MPRSNVKIGITLGCPAGIGGEVTLKALLSGRMNGIPVLIGRKEVLLSHYPEMFSALKIEPFSGEAVSGKVYLYDVQSAYKIPKLGIGSTDAASESLLYINKSIDLWRSGQISAVVTAPVNKGLIEKSGVSFMGHTEYFAEKINEPDPVMMMYSDKYSVVLVTTHYGISEIPSLVTSERIEKTVLTAYSALKKIKGREPRLAVAGLDPHCGDGGAIGTFDSDVTAPLIAKLKDKIDITGPLSADTIFMKEKWIKYDAVIAHYHDQGLIPFKMIAFENGVNVTLGLSLVRTSVDHGTAYDIAGMNIAAEGSMIEAFNLAVSLVDV